jgi:4-hydroxythreonine-4-phosphate dehydrogenase
MSLAVGIALGDVTGIGPEVTIKALGQMPADDGCCYVLLGARGEARRWCERFGVDLGAREYGGRASRGRVFIHDVAEALPTDPRAGDARAARVAVSSLRVGAELCLRGELDALVTAPVNKAAIIRSGEPFVGQTEFLSELAGTRRTAMMLLGDDDRGRWLRVVLATTHVPLRRVSEVLNRELVERAIELAAQACVDLGLPNARVAVCGLNPHAGEEGMLGTEELEVIGPAVAASRGRGLEVTGPVAADTLFHQVWRGDYEVVVAMYHDQGLAPLKMIAFDRGVNWTLGLPFIRTSPDHGTAYDLAGRGLANPSSMRAALELAKRLAARGSKK